SAGLPDFVESSSSPPKHADRNPLLPTTTEPAVARCKTSRRVSGRLMLLLLILTLGTNSGRAKYPRYPATIPYSTRHSVARCQEPSTAIRRGLVDPAFVGVFT